METVVEMKVVGPYILDLTFSDGTKRVIDLEAELYGEVFEPLRDPARFAEARVDPELGTVVWPNGADFAPEFLYSGSIEPPESQAAPTSKTSAKRSRHGLSERPQNPGRRIST